jgi:hypothetical protein
VVWLGGCRRRLGLLTMMASIDRLTTGLVDVRWGDGMMPTERVPSRADPAPGARQAAAWSGFVQEGADLGPEQSAKQEQTEGCHEDRFDGQATQEEEGHERDGQAGQPE